MPETKNETPKKAHKKMRAIRRILSVLLILAAGGALFWFVLLPRIGSGRQTTELVSDLESIREIEDLETATIIYNAVASKQNEKGDVLYYVAYNGTLTAGVDFKQIGITSDPEKKTITVTLPEASILEYKVDPGSLDYIFLKKKAETNEVSAEAYSLCVEDLKTRTASDSESLIASARENAKKAVEGLVRPWVEQIDGQYELVIQ